MGPHFFYFEIIAFYLQIKEKAERVGFEPTRRLNTAYAISSRAPSANSDTSPDDAGRVYQILTARCPDHGPPSCLHSDGDTLCGTDRREVRTAWLEPDAVCLIDQTKPAHSGVSLSRLSKRSCGTCCKTGAPPAHRDLQGQVYSLKLSARGRIMFFEA